MYFSRGRPEKEEKEGIHGLTETTKQCKGVSKEGGRKSRAEEGMENVPSLTFRLEKSEDVVLPDGTLYVSYDRTGRVVHELDANLGDSTTGTGTTEDLDNLGELDRDLVRGSLL